MKSGVNIGILDYDFDRYSSKKLLTESKKVGKPEKLDLNDICLLGEKKLSFLYNSKREIDVILPRFSSKLFELGLLTVKHFETQGIPIVNSSKAIEICQNKYLTSLALKKKRILQPNFAISISSKNLKKHIEAMKFPLVVKMLYGTEGVGALKACNWNEVRDWIETLGELHKLVYIQDYIETNEVYRIFVLDDQILYGYKKVLPKDEWKSNNRYGAYTEEIKITKYLKEFGLRCADAVKSEICAIDYILKDKEPCVIEINQAPDFYKRLKTNVAKKIINFARRKVKR